MLRGNKGSGNKTIIVNQYYNGSTFLGDYDSIAEVTKKLLMQDVMFNASLI